MVGAEVLGVTSAVVGLANLMAGIINLGVRAGCQRFFGLCLGRYDLVLRVGLAQNLPAVTSYLFLIPSLGGLGAAISYALGRFVGLVAAILAGRAVNFSFDFKGLAQVLTPSLVVGLARWALGLHWSIALVAIASLSLFSYAKLGVISRSDLREITYALPSKEMADRLGGKTRPMLDLL